MSLKHLHSKFFAEGMPELLVMRLVRQIASGLAHLHRNLVIHRDVKLENILVDSANYYAITLGQLTPEAFTAGI